jgi:hypothetical protein
MAGDDSRVASCRGGKTSSLIATFHQDQIRRAIAAANSPKSPRSSSLQTFGEVLADEVLFGEDVDGDFVARRLAIPLIGNHMVRDVEHALTGKVEISLGQVVSLEMPAGSGVRTLRQDSYVFD